MRVSCQLVIKSFGLWVLVGDSVVIHNSCGLFSKIFEEVEVLVEGWDDPKWRPSNVFPVTALVPGRDVPWPSARKCRLELGDGWKWDIAKQNTWSK